jgi:hypothetical protein
VAAARNSRLVTAKNKHLKNTIVKTPTKQTILVLLLFLTMQQAIAQLGKSKYVIRDPRVDRLVDKQIELNKQTLKDRTTVEAGFRIIVISTNKRDDATRAKGRLMKTFPDQKSYMLFHSPNFKVQFGNFRAYKEAEEMKKVLEPLFPEGLLIVPAQVEVRIGKEEKDNL